MEAELCVAEVIFLIGYLKLSGKIVFSLFRSAQDLVEEGWHITIMYVSKINAH